MAVVFDKGCPVFFSPVTTTRGVFGVGDPNFLGMLTAIDFKFCQQFILYEGEDYQLLCIDLRLLLATFHSKTGRVVLMLLI